MTAVSSTEASVVEALLASNATTVVTKEGGIVSSATVLAIPDNHSNSSSTFITVETAVGGTSVSLPLVLFADLGLSSPPILVVSTLESGAAASFAQAPQSSSEGQTLELVSAISINLLDSDGSPISMRDLVEPIRFSLPNARGSGLFCAWLDEDTGEWTNDGMNTVGLTEDGTLECATDHLTFFGAIAEGFLETLQCSQASLLSVDSYIELWSNPWYGSIGTQLLFAVLTGLLAVVAVACVLDSFEHRRGFWKTEYFLIARSAAPAAGAAFALAAGADDAGDDAAGCMDGIVGGLKEALDEFLGSIFEFLGDIRNLLHEISNAVCACATCRGDGRPLYTAALGAITRSARQTTSSTYFLLADDVETLLSDDVNELILPNQGDPTGDDQDCVFDVDGEAGVLDDDVDSEAGGLDDDVRGQPGEAGGLDDDVDGEEAMTSTKQGHPTGDSHDCVLDVESHERLVDADIIPEGVPELLPKVHGDELADAALTGPGTGLFSQSAARRHRRLVELRQSVLKHQRRQIERHATWYQLPRSLILSLLCQGPVGSVFCRSITWSHSMRALLLCVDLLGALMLATVFCAASGGAQSKKSSKGCGDECEADDGTCYYKLMGRLIAIGLTSAVIAGIPIALLNALHSREFVRVAYEGSPDWHKQLRKWRRADATIWVIGTAYSLFAVNYVCLFFANVATEDQDDWIISAGISLLEDFIVLPVLIGCTMTLTAMVLLCCVSRRYGLARSEVIQQDVETLEEADRSSVAVDTGGSDSRDPVSWSRLELRDFHDVGLADPRHLAPRSAG